MKEIVQLFTDLTGYDLAQYLIDYYSFVQSDRSKITRYYQGSDQTIPQSSFNVLNRLILESKKIEVLFLQNKSSFQIFDFWSLLVLLSDISTTLDTIQNSPRWLRSSVVDGSYSREFDLDIALKQRQTIEKAMRDLGYTNDDKWVSVAIRNDMNEEKYTSSGGIKMTIPIRIISSLGIESIVDTINGKSIYGKDIDKKITFINDDIKILNEDDTLIQSFTILLNLKKEDNPHYPKDGLRADFAIGVNMANILFPSIFRQTYEVFATDDSFKNLTISNIMKIDDTVQYEIAAETRLNDIKQEIVLL